MLLWGHFLAAAPRPRPRPRPRRRCYKGPILWWVSSLHHSPQSQMVAPAGERGRPRTPDGFPERMGEGSCFSFRATPLPLPCGERS